jgi:hypothetical protein
VTPAAAGLAPLVRVVAAARWEGLSGVYSGVAGEYSGDAARPEGLDGV